MNAIGLLLFILIKYSQTMKNYFRITEEEPVGTDLFEVSKFLRDKIKSEHRFTVIGDPNFSECISIQDKTGITKIKKRIDRETLCADNQEGKCFKSIRLIFKNTYRKEGVDLEFEILDINDNRPMWPTNVVELLYPESTEKQSIKLAIAYDKDIGENAMIKYYLQSIYHDNLNFNLENNENRLILTPKFDVDYETKRFFNITIVAEDRGRPVLSSTLNVKVTVIDINDNRPQFIQNVFHPNQAVYETTSVEAIILKVTAIDKDSEQNGRINYYIDPSMPQFIRDQFFLDSDTGELKLKKPLDYDRGHKSYKFIVIAKDSAPAPYELSSSATIEIQVADVNDEIPQINMYFTTPFVSDRYNGTVHINIPENMNPQQSDLAHIQIEDTDEDDKSFIDCSLDNKESFRLISDINKVKSFILSASKSFDRENQQTEHVRITCRDNGKNENSKIIIINVTDKNDNPPKFAHKFNFNVNENTSYRNRDIGHVEAIDKDLGKNAELRYTIINVQPRSDARFRIDSFSGKMYIDAPLDREEQDHYNITVIAVDQGEPSLTGTGNILILVEDINDMPPVFETIEYRFQIPEDASINSKVGVVQATDRDIGKNARISYHFLSDAFQYSLHRTNAFEKFQIKKDSGEIIITSKLDRETKPSYSIIIEAINVVNPRKFSATVSATITVLDCNDNAPKFTAPINNSLISIDTDKSIGTEIALFRATDADENKNAELTYSIVRATDPYVFNLDYTSGILFLAKKIESFRKLRLTVRVCDSGLPQKCSEDLMIIVTTTKSTFIDSENSNGDNNSLVKTGITESNGAIIACLIVIFVILVMAMVIMFFLIRNKNFMWKRRLDNNYDKQSISEIQVRNTDSTFSKKEAGSIYEGDLLLLNERNKANNMMQNSMYSPKIYAESQISGRPESPCYRTIDAMATSVYNPITQVPGDMSLSHINCQPNSSNRYTQQHFRGASEPVYRYSNVCGRNVFTPTMSVHPSYYQSITSPGIATIRLNKKQNETPDRFNPKVDNSNILINYDARSIPRSVSLLRFYEKQNEDDTEAVNDKNQNYDGSNRPKYAYEALREGSFI